MQNESNEVPQGPGQDPAPPHDLIEGTSTKKSPSRIGRMLRGTLRWTMRIGLTVLALGLIARLTLGFWLGPVVNHFAKGAGLHVEWTNFDLSILGLSGDLNGVRIVPLRAESGEERDQAALAAADAFAVLDDLGFDVDVSALLTGEIRLHRVELSGLEAWVSRDAKGAWNFASFAEPNQQANESADKEPSQPSGTGEGEATGASGEDAPEETALDFSIPIQIASLGVHGVRLHLSDAFLDEPLNTTLEFDATVRDVGHPDRVATLDVTARAADILDTLRIKGEIKGEEAALQANLTARLDGLGVGRLGPYLAGAGIRPAANKLNASFEVMVDLAPIAPSEQGAAPSVGGEAALRLLQFNADGEPAVTVDRVGLKLAGARSQTIHMAEVDVTGVRGHAMRLVDGTLRVAGLDLVGAPESPTEEPEAPDEPEPDAPDGGSKTKLRVDEVRLADIRFQFDDRGVLPAAALDAGVSGTVRSLVLGGDAPTPVEVDLSLDVAGTGAFALEGTAVIEGPTKVVALQLSGSDLTLGSIAPYLAAAGLESTLTEGALEATIAASVQSPQTDEGPLTVQAALEKVRLFDGKTEHLALEVLRVANLVQDPSGELRIESLALVGAQLPAALIADGGFEGFGLRTSGVDPGAAREPAGVLDATLNVQNLTLGGDGGQATIDAEMELVGLANKVELRGDLRTGKDPLDIDVEFILRGEGFRYTAIEKLLAGSGLTSELESGSGTLTLKATTSQEGETLRADAELSELRFESKGEELAALDSVQLAGAVIDGPHVDVASVRIVGARLPASRSADGVLHFLGVAAGGPGPEQAPRAADPAEKTPPAGAGLPTGRKAARTGAAEPLPTDPTAAAPRFTLGLLELDQVEVTWADAAVTPAVATKFSLGAGVQSVRLDGAELSPLRAKITAALEGAVEAVDIQIAASAGALGADVDVSFDLRGLRAGPLASYLPDTLPVLLEDGRMKATLRAQTRPLEGGGQSILATLGGVDFRDGAGGDSLLAFDELRFNAPRIDPEGAVFDIEEVTVSGFAFDVQKISATRYEMLGVAFDSSLQTDAPPGPGNAAPEKDAPDALDPSGNPGADTKVADAGPGGERSTGEIEIPDAPAPPPTVTLGKLDIGIDRLRYIDRTRTDAVPLDLSLALKTPGAQTLLAPDPTDLPPVVLAIQGALTPLVKKIDVTLRAEPFAADPGAMLTALLEGIDGAALERVDPDLAASIDPSGYVDGSLEIGVDARLSVARRGPMDFDFARGFGAMIAVAPFAIRPTPGAEPTGFERFDVEIKRISPATGDVRVASAELTGIHARVEQRADGMHVAGLRLPAPSETELDESGQGTQAEKASDKNGDGETMDPSEPTDTAAPAAASPEFAIDRLLVSGVDFAYTDLRVEPAFILPVADAQLEVQRFTTRTFEEARPFSFRLILDAGEVPLPERSGADNLLFGVLGSMADAATLQSKKFEIEQRRVWDLLEVSGRLSLGPEIRGRVSTSLLGLELPAFMGLAAQGGVEIGDGLVDNQVKLRFRSDGGLGINSKTVSSYLSLSEPPGGPISKYLQLPAPLDTVLFLLRNEDGAQEIPVRLDIPEDGVSMGQVAGLAAQTLGLLITDAVSSAPLRVLGPLSDVAGALGLGGAPLTADSVTLAFDGGAATLAASRVQWDSAEASGAAAQGGPQAQEPLAEAANALRLNPDLRIVLQASLGAKDLEVAQRIANPSRDVVQAMIQSHRDRKAVIERERSLAAARANAQLAAGSLDLVETTNERLQALDGDRRDTEAALDSLFARIRPGAERRAEMRTRNAAIALGKERMDRVRSRLVELAGPAAGSRIDVRRPRFVPQREDAPLPDLGVVTITPQ